MTLTLYGIKNCDTVKKARTWLKDRDIEYTFYNYKKDGFDEASFTQALAEHGWETVINRRGTTWRQLPEDVQNAMDEATAREVARENPSIIKRPILLKDGKTHLGFKPDQYEEIFK